MTMLKPGDRVRPVGFSLGQVGTITDEALAHIYVVRWDGTDKNETVLPADIEKEAECQIITVL